MTLWASPNISAQFCYVCLELLDGLPIGMIISKTLNRPRSSDQDRILWVRRPEITSPFLKGNRLILSLSEGEKSGNNDLLID